jgi:copper(I)-binding protein
MRLRARLPGALSNIGSGFVLAALLAAPAQAVDIRLSSAWMRPAAAGSDARAYVDIHSDAPLTLVGASTPLARKVAIVVVRKTDGLDPGKVVRRLPVSAGTPTRLAYKGNHLLLAGVRRDIANGTPVPLTLEFRDAAGKRYEARTDLRVRGLLLPHPAASRLTRQPAPPSPAPR